MSKASEQILLKNMNQIAPGAITEFEAEVIANEIDQIQKPEGAGRVVKMSEENSIVLPAVTAQKALEAWKSYQELKEKVITSEDTQEIGGKKFVKKSGWRKLARFFNLSVEITEERSEIADSLIVFHFKARAIAPNGAYAEGVGSCDSGEKGVLKSIHNTRTIAETRAWNRAVSNLIGAGEVSAEEINDDQPHASDQPRKKPAWVIGTCKMCGSDLCTSKKDPLKYYCSNWDGTKSKDGKKCDVRGNISDIEKKETSTAAA